MPVVLAVGDETDAARRPQQVQSQPGLCSKFQVRCGLQGETLVFCQDCINVTVRKTLAVSEDIVSASHGGAPCLVS